MSEPSGFKRIFFNIFLCISMVQTQAFPGEDLFWTWGPLLKKKQVKEFQAAEPSSSGEEDFKVYFTCKPRTPGVGPIGP